MATRILDILIELPDSPSERAVQIAREKAREAAIVALQQEGELTIREAASALGLEYEEYLNLLATRRLPVSPSMPDAEALEEFCQRLRRPGDIGE